MFFPLTGSIRYQKVREVRSPERGTAESAGIDMFVPEDFEGVSLKPGQSVNIPSGIKFDFPIGYAFIAFNKSGVAVKKSLQVGACVVDSDYTGEVHLNLINIGDKTQEIAPGDKLVQFIMVPIKLPALEQVDSIDKVTERGDGAFGSTNK